MKKMYLVLVVVLACFFTVPVSCCFASPSSAPAGSETAVEKVNINTAGEAELLTIPGVGPKMAKKILEQRKKVGQFAAYEDLLAVKGIGEKSLQKMLPHMTM